MDEGGDRALNPARPVRVMLLLESLHGGGAERVAVALANGCDPDRIDVQIALLRPTGPYLAEVDPQRLVVAPLTSRLVTYDGPTSGFYRLDRMLTAATLPLLDIAATVRRQRPDVLISFCKGMNLAAFGALPLAGGARPVWIAREGNNIGQMLDIELGRRPLRSLVEGLTHACYRSADCCLANAKGLAEMLAVQSGVDGDKLRVIPNPIDLARIRRLACEPLADPPARPFVISAGRLEHQKGHDLLIQAFAAAPACASLDLVILGRGQMETALRRLASELGVADRVHFPGFVANPWSWLAKARLFVLPSRFEGFPTALAEALACGCPALATDCDYGPGEMVAHGQNGWLAPVDDMPALAAAMQDILSNPEAAAMVAARGRASVERLDLPHIVGAYSRLFVEQALARSPTAVAELQLAAP